MSEDDIICYCFDVTVKDIKEAYENGFTTVEQIGNVTQAGSMCGACISDIIELLASFSR